jgi:hypothetical protein
MMCICFDLGQLMQPWEEKKKAERSPARDGTGAYRSRSNDRVVFNEGLARTQFAMFVLGGQNGRRSTNLKPCQFPRSYGHLRLNPMWDPLRGHPLFEKIVTSLAPK